MKKYRVFEEKEYESKMKGVIELRLDDEDKTIFRKLREIGYNITGRKNRIEWWDDNYIEVVDKKTYKTVAIIDGLSCV